jgi:hypothetical protein
MRVAQAILVVSVLLTSVACGQEGNNNTGGQSASPRPSPTSSYPPNVVHLDGIGPIRFGENRTALAGRRLISPSEEIGCDGEKVYDIPGYTDAADLIFNGQGKLGFVWVLQPGVWTPEKLTVESSIADVRKAYPGAEELPPTERSFPGLLVKSEKTALLFLYEPTTRKVVKLLAGFTDILRDAQREGISC